MRIEDEIAAVRELVKRYSKELGNDAMIVATKDRLRIRI